VTLISIFFKRN